MDDEMIRLREILSWDKCIECGDCLVNCRYIEFTRQGAIDDIKMINKGLHLQSRAVKKCMSCYACNAFCPNDAHPYERIHYAWNERYEKQGLPARASYLMPGRQPNFRQSLKYTKREIELHSKWASKDPPAGTCLYPGCNLLAMPLLADGMVFDKLPVWGTWDLCCGEMFFRMGLLEPVRKTAERLTDFYHGKEIEELVFVCPAGYNMFSNILPEQFGARFDFKKTYFTDWLMRMIENGTFTLKKKISGSVVMHDSCHARVLGNGFMDSQRRLLKMLGLRIIETEQNREHGLCCGVAAGCNNYSLVDLAKCGFKGISALDATDADEAAIYCTGCLLTMGIFRLLNPFGKRLRHVVEYSREALGEKVERNNTWKAIQIALGIGVNALPRYLDTRRFKL